MDALCSTDGDTLLVRDAHGHKLGTILLIWGNSPEEVVCDHTDNEAIGRLVEGEAWRAR